MMFGEDSEIPSSQRSAAYRTPSSGSPLDFGVSSDRRPNDDENLLQRSRSASFSMRFRQAGGVNSIDNFARSWQRAACFPEVFPRRLSIATVDSDEDWHGSSGDFLEPQGSLHADLGPALTRPLLSDNGVASGQRDSILNTSHLESSFGTSYGTISSRVSESAQKHVIEFHRQQQTHPEPAVSHDGEPLLLKQVQHEDGTRENIVVGQSTVPQTIFNSVNVLIGVGLLSLPIAMKHAGWLLGLIFLLFAAVTTSYTAKILAKCLDVDRSLVTYADLAYISFGHHARLVISLLFCLELLGACVALVVLFADSLHVLFPGLSIPQWQIICGLMLIPLSFVPLRFLSVTSILGILSCTSIVVTICIDGFIKPHAPGSLREPAQTYLFPENWGTLPLSFGLIMSPWGGHGVFPNIYRDMRHPHKYGRSLWATYIFTYSLDCAMAVIGWTMFGNTIRDEVTGNVLTLDGYPQFLSICIIVFIAIIPITKVPLNSRPLVATVEVLCGLEERVELNTDYTDRMIAIRRTLRVFIRILIVALIVVMAIIFPSFDRIMALMGSALCFTICIILPLAFYLKIFGKEINPKERFLDWFLLITSSVLAVIGTAWAFLPQEMIISM
ncbi:transmembrane amino acid transporter protein-domain-containing protein [Aspergillus cavernicola]|uniref:Transmembrane amino acid transporter protein-domain-containing protein n=1 Tax=Aspergillus cavernicola TaxID=176166 RepID=A0ABR4I8B2_9EURO